MRACDDVTDEGIEFEIVEEKDGDWMWVYCDDKQEKVKLGSLSPETLARMVAKQMRSAKLLGE